jgi:DNA replication protein DnaC
MNISQRYDLMEIMDDRYGENSTVMISQLPVSEYYSIIGDNTLADTILDRAFHNSAIRLN